MPGKRKKGKKLIAGWLQEGDAEDFKALAEGMGTTVTDLLTRLIQEELKRNNKTLKRNNNGK